MRAEARALASLCCLVLVGCYASNVVAKKDRAVATELPETWKPAGAADMAGLFASVAIRGDAALSLRRVWYWFDAGGRYAAAALLDGEDGVAFQTRNGRWSLGAGGLQLDEGEAVYVLAADGFLLLSTEGGEVVLRRDEAQ